MRMRVVAALALLLFAGSAQAQNLAAMGGGTPCSEWFKQGMCVPDFPPIFSAGRVAKGDGVTDDTGNLQAVSKQCEDAGGGVIWLPKGTYLASQWTVGSHCSVVGSGWASIVKCAATEPNACIHASAGQKLALGGVSGTNNYGNPVTDVGFYNFKLDANGTARQGGTAGYVRGLVVAHRSSKVTVNHVWFVDGGSRALEVNPSTTVRVIDNLCEDSSHVVGKEGDCLHVGNPCNNGAREPPGWCTQQADFSACQDVVFRGNTVNRAGDVSLSGQNCLDVTFEHNHMFGDEYFGQTPTSDNGGIEAFGSLRVRALGNDLNKIRNACFWMQTTTDLFGHVWQSDNITIDSNFCSRGTTLGVALVGSVFISGNAAEPTVVGMTNNEFRDAPVETIALNNQVAAATIANNRIFNSNVFGLNANVDAAVILGGSCQSACGTPGCQAGCTVPGDTTGCGCTSASTGDVNNVVAANNRIEIASGGHARFGILQQDVGGQGTVFTGNSVVNASQSQVRILGGAVMMANQWTVSASLVNTGAALNFITQAERGSRAFCTDCQYDSVTGVCCTSGGSTICPNTPAGTAGRWAEKRVTGNVTWCCQSGQNPAGTAPLTTCG